MQITTLLQFIQGSLNTRADLLSRPNLGIGSEWSLHQQVVQDLLHQWPAIIDLFPASLTARLPVFFAPVWESKATGVDAFLHPWVNLQAYAFPPIAIIRRVLLKLESLSPLRSHPDRPLLISKGKGFQIFGNFYQTFQLNYPNVEICCVATLTFRTTSRLL